LGDFLTRKSGHAASSSPPANKVNLLPIKSLNVQTLKIAQTTFIELRMVTWEFSVGTPECVLAPY